MNAKELERTLAHCLRLLEGYRKRGELCPNCARIALVCMGSLLHGVDRHLMRELTVKEAAQLSGKSESQIRRMVRQGKLTSVSDGRPIRIPASQLSKSKSERDEILSVVGRFKKAVARELDLEI